MTNVESCIVIIFLISGSSSIRNAKKPSVFTAKCSTRVVQAALTGRRHCPARWIASRYPSNTRYLLAPLRPHSSPSRSMQTSKRSESSWCNLSCAMSRPDVSALMIHHHHAHFCFAILQRHRPRVKRSSAGGARLASATEGSDQHI